MNFVVEMQEEWRSIPGWEGWYEVSNLGRVRSLPRKTKCRTGCPDRFAPGRLLKPYCPKEYPTVSLTRRGVVVRKKVHHLVAESFIGPRPEGLQVAHNDGDRLNPRWDNLRYATLSENQQDRLRHGTHNRGSKSGKARLTEIQVARIKRDSRICREIAADYGVHQNTISSIRHGYTWRHVA